MDESFLRCFALDREPGVFGKRKYFYILVHPTEIIIHLRRPAHYGWELLPLLERERERSRESFVVIWECACVLHRWRWRATISRRQVVFNKRGFLTHWEINYGFPGVGGRQKRERETQKVRYIQLGRNLRQQEWKAASLSLHYPWALCSSSPVSLSMSFRWDIHTLKNHFLPGTLLSFFRYLQSCFLENTLRYYWLFGCHLY